jgi:hypothetical protein
MTPAETNQNWHERNTTLCIVNYFSHQYIHWQLKILSKLDQETSLIIYIIDNSRNDKESRRLKQVIDKSPKNLLVNLIFTPHFIFNNASEDHANSLNKGLELAKINKSKYFVTLDPDCFFLRKDILTKMKDGLSNEDLVSIGTPLTRDRRIKIEQ